MYNLIVLKVPSNPNCQASLSQACVSIPKRSLAFGDAVFVVLYFAHICHLICADGAESAFKIVVF